MPHVYDKIISLTGVSRPDRLRDIADRFNLDQEAVLDNVLYARAYTSKNLFSISLDFSRDNFNSC